MDPREYERLRDHEETYWWHVARRELISALLRWGVPPDEARPGLDVGCGTGSNFEILAPYGRFVGTEIGVDLYAGAGRPSRPVVVARGERLPFPDRRFGLCTLFDVLEHVEKEDEMLGEVRRVLRPSGLTLISVPAYMFLWSDHDVSLHHHRRYVRRTLRDALTRNGFEVIRITYGMASILPLVAGYRWLARLRTGSPTASYVSTPGPVGRLLTAVLGLEARWIGTADLPFGTSLLGLARKA